MHLTTKVLPLRALNVFCMWLLTLLHLKEVSVVNLNLRRQGAAKRSKYRDSRVPHMKVEARIGDCGNI